MSVILLYLGLVLTPFYELLLKVCPYMVSISPDTRTAKLFVGMWFALALGVSACFSNGFKPLRNKWILLLLFSLPLNISLAPQYDIILNGISTPNYWVWKPFAMCLCYFLMFMYVQSMDITKSIFMNISKVMVWCGFVMACYCILQDFGWEQFFDIRTGGFNNEFFGKVTKPVTVGSLGNSTIVSPYMAMIIPFALYLRKWVVAGVMVYAVWACHSSMAIGAMIASLALYSCLMWKDKGVLAVLMACLVGFSFISWVRFLDNAKYMKWQNSVMQTNGRMPVWKKAVEVLKIEKFGTKNETRQGFTGTGIGSYSVVVSPRVQPKFIQAHNEYLEVMVTMGLCGIFLFVMALLSMAKGAVFGYLGYNQAEIIALSCSFLCLALTACGTFIWQLSPFQYYSVLLAGLLHNRNLLKGDWE